MKDSRIIYSILSLLLFLSGCRTEKDMVGSFKRTISYSDSTVYFFATQDVPNIKNAIKSNAFIHYFKNGAISRTEAGYYGEVLNGEYAVLNTKNRLIYKGKFIDGLKEDTWIRWNAEGRILVKSSYKDGVKHGVEEKFLGDTLRIITKFKNGKKHGIENWYNNRDIRIKKLKYSNGLIHGKVKTYDQSGKLESIEKYRRGELTKQKEGLIDFLDFSSDSLLTDTTNATIKKGEDISIE